MVIVKGIPDWAVWVGAAGVVLYVGWRVLGFTWGFGQDVQLLEDKCPICGDAPKGAACQACLQKYKQQILGNLGL